MNEEKSELLKKIGENIVYYRNKKGLKQIDLAIATNMEDSALRRIEKGRTNPTVLNLYRICTALNIELKDLLDFSQ